MTEAYAGTIEDARRDGFERGKAIASWVDLPEIGSTLPKYVDWVGVGTIEDVNDAGEAFSMLASEAESANRDFSPFEFTAAAFNESEDSEALWEAFDAGISEGIAADWEERKGYYVD